MTKMEVLQRQLERLPSSMLDEVEQMIIELRKRKKPATLLTELAASAIEDDLPADLAKHHDHYLYGTPKE